jgi:crotonobetainyl-CoA:carnitine CoA-transferase CaiB-like acyl-CoA transferase
VRQLGLPLKFSATPPNYGKAGGATGAHTKEVMTVLGYSEAEIKELGKDGLFG